MTRDRDPDHALRAHRVGFTDLAKRATVGADELAPEELRAGMARVERLCAWLQPGALCLLGLAGWLLLIGVLVVCVLLAAALGGPPRRRALQE